MQQKTCRNLEKEGGPELTKEVKKFSKIWDLEEYSLKVKDFETLKKIEKCNDSTDMASTRNGLILDENTQQTRNILILS